MPASPPSPSPDLLVLSNGVVEAGVSVAFGPRVLRYAMAGGANLFAEAPFAPIDTAFGSWRPRGGHRLWVAPESMPGSYAPDDGPVQVERQGPLSARFRSPVDRAGIGKEMTLTLATTGTLITVDHVIVNHLCWPIEVAPWGITAMVPDGVAILPQPRFRSHDDELLPVRPLVQWAFTDMADARWSLGSRLIRLTPHAARPAPQKIGAGNREGWCALVRGTTVYFKSVDWRPGVRYPDLGCNNEVYTAGDYLELESLGPLQVLAPGEAATHQERWAIATGVSLPIDEDAMADHLAELARLLFGAAA